MTYANRIVTEDELDVLVSIAICRAEILDELKSSSASEAWREVMHFEERLASITSASEIAGGIARVGAIGAALSAGQRAQAARLASMYLSDKTLPEERRSAIKRLFAENQENLANRFPVLAGSGRLADVDHWRTLSSIAKTAQPKGFEFNADYVARLRDKDPETERHFVTHFSTVIWLRLRNRLKSKEMLANIRQETFYRVMRFIHSGEPFDQPEHLGVFVQSTCTNVMLEFLRGDAKYSQLNELPLDLEGKRINIEERHLDIEGELVSEERKRAVQDVLSQMPSKDQQILRMLFLEDADRDVVCRQFNIESDYLRVLLHRAKARFRTGLKAVGLLERHGKTEANLGRY